MSITKLSALYSSDDLWTRVREETTQAIADEALLSKFLHSAVLDHSSLEESVTYIIADKLRCDTLKDMTICQVIGHALQDSDQISQSIRADLNAFYERDPACDRYLLPLLYFKGFHALTAYRVTHWLWQNNRKDLALFLQNRISECFAVDIHPGATIGHGIMIDHATSLVIGETAEVGNNVSILHAVTLGGTGKEIGNRHPNIKDGVLIGAGAKLLGNITVGEGAKVGAGSVVLENVKAHCTVVGVPAVHIGRCCQDQPALEMDQLPR